MKKFKGIVNDVTYENKKDFDEAVNKALKDGKVQAHYYYTEIEDSDESDRPKKLYQLTKEDMDEIRTFNKNWKQFTDLWSPIMSNDSLKNIFKYLQ